ncbi:MAG: hypothetical protein HRU40_20465 [Saprospiraceae bacterium]|nr:hypothetical protein [Saprospiraceae bacterium]
MRCGAAGESGRDYFLPVEMCSDCAIDMRGVAAGEIIRRQVEDIPPIESIVTEYQIEWKTSSVIKKTAL